MLTLPRPHYHFTPPANFMNDPNGLVFYQGEYHLFYQHNPFGDTWGHMSWGHAVSRDLAHWEHLPVALYEEDGVMIFSGSAVVDWRNTSGLGASDEPPLVAIYTGHTAVQQTQNIAYSNDHGRTWTKHVGNPVIAINLPHFRDPKVLWHEATRQWIMVTVLADQQKVRFFGSPDLKRWTHLSDFGPAGAVDNEWECPDLFPLTVEGQPGTQKWILKVDVNRSILAQYFVGHFDGTRFVNDAPSDQVLRVDYGKDFYAAQSWSDAPDGQRLWLGWMNNWDYANVIPTSPWRGLFSIPREVALRQYSGGLRLVQSRITGLESLRQQHYHSAGEDIANVNADLAARGDWGVAVEIEAEFAMGAAAEFGIKVRKGEAEETRIGYDALVGELFVDRRRSGNVGFAPAFPGQHRGPLPPEQGKIKLHVFVDACSVEVFGNDGRTVISDLIFPDPHSTGVEFYASGGEVRLMVLDVWTVRSALPEAL
jgi:fructan beta-fructosidase